MLDSVGSRVCVLSWSLRCVSVDLRRNHLPHVTDHAAILCSLEWARLCHVEAACSHLMRCLPLTDLETRREEFAAPRDVGLWSRRSSMLTSCWCLRIWTTRRSSERCFRKWIDATHVSWMLLGGYPERMQLEDNCEVEAPSTIDTPLQTQQKAGLAFFVKASPRRLSCTGRRLEVINAASQLAQSALLRRKH